MKNKEKAENEYTTPLWLPKIYYTSRNYETSTLRDPSIITEIYYSNPMTGYLPWGKNRLKLKLFPLSKNFRFQNKFYSMEKK